MPHFKNLGLLFVVAALGVAALGIGNPSYAAQPSAPGSPRITDPLHHLSGVIAVPQALMRNLAGPRGVFGPLTPPVFGPNVDASLGNPSAQNETTIAINPEDNQRVIASANDYRCGLCPYVYLSTNGGTNWTNYAVPGTGGLSYGDPAMAFGRGGAAYFSFLGYTGSVCSGGGGMFTARSTDAGLTFSAPVMLASNSITGSVAILHDKEYVAVDTNPTSPYFNNAYVGWTHFAFRTGTNCGYAESQVDASTLLSRSTNGGLTWSVPITASPPISNNNQGTVPAVGHNGEVYLYYSGAQTQTQLNYDSILFSRSTDGGQTFPFFTHIAPLVDLPNPLPHTNFRNNAWGAMAVDGLLPGYLYAVWSDYGTGDADILFSRSTDNGTTWGPPQRVNDDPVGNGKDQFFPWIAASPDGRVHISWLDRRDDPTDINYKAYYADSIDHGVSFEPNVVLSTDFSYPGNSAFIGDYTGIAATTGVVMPIWTDIRTGNNQNAFTARGIFDPNEVASPTATAQPAATGTATATHTATAAATATATATTTALQPTATETPAPPTPCTVEFTDVPPSSPFYPYIRCLVCRGIVSGYADGTFRPGFAITRGQTAKLVSNAAGFQDAIPSTQQTFTDVPTRDPFWIYIERLAAPGRNYISGYQCGVPPAGACDNQNRPWFLVSNNVTRGQIAKIVANAAGLNNAIPSTQQTFSDVPTGNAFWIYIERLAPLNVISGYTCGSPPAGPCDPQNRPYFLPFNSATRGQTAKIVANTFFPNCQTPARR
ncbi:MAG TPA: S-layer homology domain-containing protein [Chloroflexia bacterium]|nr:S-layer homology domain-containing protein [Chloroflexia bacterium]